jgi:hypothetical protein
MGHQGLVILAVKSAGSSVTGSPPVGSFASAAPAPTAARTASVDMSFVRAFMGQVYRAAMSAR